MKKDELIEGFTALGVKEGMALEVHSSLSSFDYVEGGAGTVIQALMETVGTKGSIVMPSFLHSKRCELSNEESAAGIKYKIRILDKDEPVSGMGVIADTFRRRKDVVTGTGLYRVSAWGKDAVQYSKGFHKIIEEGGYALLLGVDIYSLSSMHHVEEHLPKEIRDKFSPPEVLQKKYPEDKWIIETWEPEGQPWYKIQKEACAKGYIKDLMIGSSKCMFFQVDPVISLYKRALINEPYLLYGLKTEK